MRQHGQHLERETALDVGKRHDRILEMVQHQHEQQTESQRDHGTGRENDKRVRQYRLGRHLGRTTKTDLLVVLFGGDAALVLLLQKILV